MFNSLRNNSLIVLISLLLWIPLTGFGQTTIRQQAKVAKLSLDLYNLQLKSAGQKSIDQQSGNLRRATPSTEINSLAKPRDNSKFAAKQGLLNGDQAKTINKSSGKLRQASLSADDIRRMKVDLTQVRNGMVAIDAIAIAVNGQALLNDLQALGLKNGKYYQRIVSGYFPIDKLDQLRNVSTLRFARSAYRPLRDAGKVTSQGDKAMHADIARQTYNVTGAGSKIGILSDSYDALGGAAEGVASGDLPNVQVLKDGYLETDSSLTDEGRAMAEIVHDVAPGADIAFYTAFESYVDFASGIIELAKAGCNIVTDDIYYFAEPFFQDGIVSQAVDYVNKNWNVSYFKSAGNAGRNSYSSGFRNSGKLPPGLPDFPLKGSAHDFGNGKITQKITIVPGGTFNCVFQWSDPFYSESILSGGVSGAKTNVDLLVYYQGELIPELSSAYDDTGLDPIEITFIRNPFDFPLELEIALVKTDGPDPTHIKWVDFGNFGASYEFDTQSSTVVGHANAKGAISVGAAWYVQTPAFNPTRYPTPRIEYYSSAGGTPILYTTYGQPIPAETRLKPDVVAPDGANTTFFYPGVDYEDDGFPNFDGTSAAAPHAAGVAALLQEKAHNSMSPATISLRLRTTAMDMDDPFSSGFDNGFDFGTGFGLIQADKALMIDGQPLVLLEPIYDCATGAITIRTSGGDGTPITFTIPGVTRTSPTSTTGVVEAELRNDPKHIIIKAMQSGVTVVYDFDFTVYCNNQGQSRLAAAEPGAGLQVTTLGNPIASDWVEIEVRGVKGQPLKLQVNNILGELTGNRSVEMAESVERHKISLGRSPGLYFLQVSTPTESKVIKLIRQ